MISPLIKTFSSNGTIASSYRPVYRFLTYRFLLKCLNVLLTGEPSPIRTNTTSYRMLSQHTDVAIPSRHRDVTVQNVLRSNRRNGQQLTSASASTDLSAVFNTVPHDIILRRWMSTSFGITKSSCNCSILTSNIERGHCFYWVIRRNHGISPLVSNMVRFYGRYSLPCTRTVDIMKLIRVQYILNRGCAEDNQLYWSCSVLKTKVISCIGDVAQWMEPNRLKLNPSKSACCSVHLAHCSI